MDQVVENGEGALVVPSQMVLIWEYPPSRLHVGQAARIVWQSGRQVISPPVPPAPRGYWTSAFTITLDLTQLDKDASLSIFGAARLTSGGEPLVVWRWTFDGGTAGPAWQSPKLRSAFGCGFYARTTRGRDVPLNFFVLREA